MKKVAAFLSICALVCAGSVASADVLNLPDSGNFDNDLAIVEFSFPDNPSGEVQSIKSISIDLSHDWASDVIITLAGQGGAAFVLANGDGGSDDLGGGNGFPGTYTFVNDASLPTLGAGGTGGGNNAPGTYNAFQWADGPFPKDGWVFSFEDQLSTVDSGTWGNISIEFNKNVIPEPATGLILLGTASLALVRRRR